MLSITITRPDRPPEVVRLDKREVLIGRRPTNDVVLASPDVSGVHACLRRDGDEVTLVDLGSTNGSLVNGRRVQLSGPLMPADEVTIAAFRLRVALDASPPIAPGSLASPAALVVPGLSGHREPPLLDELPLVVPPLAGDDLPPLAPSSAASLSSTSLPPLAAPSLAAPSLARPSVAAPIPASADLGAILDDPAVLGLRVAGETMHVDREGGAVETLPAPSARDLDHTLAERVPGLAAESGVLEVRLADGAALRASRGPRGCLLSLRRPRPARALAEWAGGAAAAVELRRHLAGGSRLLILVEPDAPAEASLDLLAALGAATGAPGALVCGAIEPLAPRPSVDVLDAAPPAQAAAIRLARDLGRAWIAALDPDPSALVALAALSGVAALVAVAALDVAVALSRVRPYVPSALLLARGGGIAPLDLPLAPGDSSPLGGFGAVVRL